MPGLVGTDPRPLASVHSEPYLSGVTSSLPTAAVGPAGTA